MNRYALVVGVSFYRDKENFKTLKKAANDAEAIETALKQGGSEGRGSRHGYKVEMPFRGGTVTGAQLGKTLRDFLNKTATKNEALIYFIGHGFQVVDNLGITQGYLATSDCEVTLQNGRVIEQKNGLSLSSLSGLIQKSDLRSLVVVLDACHSGEFLEKALVQKSLTEFGQRSNYILMAGCRSTQQAAVKKRAAHSVFTGAFLEGMSPDNAHEGEITAGVLYDFISKRLRYETQEPIYMGAGRTIVLLEYLSPQKTSNPILDEYGEEVCPYQGLKAFEGDQRAFFFGRKKIVEKIKEVLDKNSFIPVIGASGSGKSSVIRAGLIPWVEARDDWTVLEIIKPGDEPLDELRGAFKPFFKTNSGKKRLKMLVEGEVNETEAIAQIIQHMPKNKRFLLVVDQFEEVFTVCSNLEARSRFIQLITNVASLSSSCLSVVMTMRADFLEPCLHYDSLYTQIDDHTVYMPPLQGADLREAIVAPAQRQGYGVNIDLVDRIQDEVGKEPGALPLLEFALTMLWERRDRQKRQLRLEQYEQLGGLTGSLNQHAERVYEYRDFERDEPSDSRDEVDKAWIKQIFLELVRIGAQEKDTRQRRRKGELLQLGGTDLIEDWQELLEGEQGLVQGRLLVSSGKDGEEGWIDLVHESLLGGWQRFANWRQENRDQRRLMQRLRDAEQEWRSRGKDVGYLIQGGFLAEVRQQWHILESWVFPNVKDFYTQSSQQEQDRIVTLSNLLTESKLRGESLRLERAWSDKPLLESLTQAIEILGENREKLSSNLLASVQGSIYKGFSQVCQSTVICWHQMSVHCLAFSPDGKTIASGGDWGGAIRLWHLDGTSAIESLRYQDEYKDAIVSVAFSPDGKTIASCSSGGKVRLWYFNEIPATRLLSVPHKFLKSVAFSPDGKTIASGSSDGEVQLWHLDGTLAAEPFIGHKYRVNSVAFSPDGKIIASASSDTAFEMMASDNETIRLWHLDGTPAAEPFTGHTGSVDSIAFSSDGKIIASANSDTVRFWRPDGTCVAELFKERGINIRAVAFSADFQTIAIAEWGDRLSIWQSDGMLIAELFEGLSLNSVAFSPDGQVIASGSDDGTVRLVQLDEIPVADSSNYHADIITSVAFSPDGKMIASGSSNGEVQLWYRDGTLAFSSSSRHDSIVDSVAFSPDGQMMVSSGLGRMQLWHINGTPTTTFPIRFRSQSVAFSPDGQIIASSSDGCVGIQLWYLDGMPAAKPFEESEEYVESVAFSPDGQMIASGNRNGAVRLWYLDGTPATKLFEGHENTVACVAFSPDGQMIVSGDWDGAVRLWHLDGTLAAKPFEGHKYKVTSVAFSPDGKLVVSGSSDCTLRFWHLDGTPIAKPSREYNGQINSIAFDPNGKAVVIGGSNGLQVMSYVSWHSWLQVCCDRLQPHLDENPSSLANRACLIERAHQSAEIGNTKAALTQFKSALQIPMKDEPVLDTAAIEREALRRVRKIQAQQNR